MTEIQKWRIKAHEALDRWTFSHDYSKAQAYKKMAKLMNTPRKGAHISKLNITQCKELIVKLEMLMGVKIR